MSALTKAQRSMLVEAARMPRLGFDGVGSRNCARRRMLERMAEAGLLRDVGLGVLADGDGFTEKPERWMTVYEITDAGRSALGAPEPKTKE
jgi:hypothetical protein